MTKSSERWQMGDWCIGLTLAGVSVATTGCFRDEGPGQQCPQATCGATDSSTGGTSTTSSSSGSENGAPVDPLITLRLDSMAFIDPHLFVSEMEMDSGTGGGPTCTSDITVLVNELLASDIGDGEFNLLIRFEANGAEVRVVDGDCEPSTTPGESWVCSPSDKTPPVILMVDPVEAPPCRELDTSVFKPINVPMINEPVQPCVRTRPAQFSLPISNSVAPLNLRDAQIVASLDDAVAPGKLTQGVLSGFLPMATAEDLVLDVALLGMIDLWSVLEVPACDAVFPELLPNVDTFEINGEQVPGVWLAINFTAERVEYRP